MLDKAKRRTESIEGSAGNRRVGRSSLPDSTQAGYRVLVLSPSTFTFVELMDAAYTGFLNRRSSSKRTV